MNIPILLVLYRFLLGPVLILLALNDVRGIIFLPLLLSGMLSDYFDGVIARKHGIDTPFLRRSDSMVDVFYYICVLITAYLVNESTLVPGLWLIVTAVGLEVLCIVFSLVKFSALPATHAYSAKLYGLFLAVTFMALIAFEATSQVWLYSLFAVALLSNIEILMILALSRTPPVDVKSVFILRRQAG